VIRFGLGINRQDQGFSKYLNYEGISITENGDFRIINVFVKRTNMTLKHHSSLLTPLKSSCPSDEASKRSCSTVHKKNL
jgi:hypothetical protein